MYLLNTVLLSLHLLGCGDQKTEPAVEKAEQASSKENSKASIPAQNSEDIGTILAMVNGTAVGERDYKRAASRKAPSNGSSLNEKEKSEVLDKLVSEELLFQEAFQRGLYRDPKVRKVMVNALLREDVYSKVRNSDFSEEQIKAYYEEHKDEFAIPEKVQISRILIKVTEDRDDQAALAEAERIYKQVRSNDTSFRDIASKLSEGPYKRRGGDVGFISRKGKPGLDEQLVEKAFSMKRGQISKPFKTKDGYNIIYLKERRDAMERGFQQMKGSVLRKLKNEKLTQMYEEYTTSLEVSAEITKSAEKLTEIEVPPTNRPSLTLPNGGKKNIELPSGLPDIGDQ